MRFRSRFLTTLSLLQSNWFERLRTHRSRRPERSPTTACVIFFSAASPASSATWVARRAVTARKASWDIGAPFMSSCYAAPSHPEHTHAFFLPVSSRCVTIPPRLAPRTVKARQGGVLFGPAQCYAELSRRAITGAALPGDIPGLHVLMCVPKNHVWLAPGNVECRAVDSDSLAEWLRR